MPGASGHATTPALAELLNRPLSWITSSAKRDAAPSSRYARLGHVPSHNADPPSRSTDCPNPDPNPKQDPSPNQTRDPSPIHPSRRPNLYASHRSNHRRAIHHASLRPTGLRRCRAQWR